MTGMQPGITPSQTVAAPVTYGKVEAALKALPVSLLDQVYAYLLELASASQSGVDLSWLNASEEQMLAEDAAWEAAFQADPDGFARLADHARDALLAGQATGIGLDNASGELVPMP
jgi:hypothetical protein